MDPQSPNKQNNDNEQPDATLAQPGSTFSQEMPGTAPAVPALVPGEHPVDATGAPEKQPMIRKDDNGTTVIDFSDRRRKVAAICTLIIGIASVLLSVVWPAAAVAAIIAILYGVIGLARNFGGKKMFIAGIVLGCITLVVLVPLSALYLPEIIDSQAR